MKDVKCTLWKIWAECKKNFENLNRDNKVKLTT